MLKEIRIYHNIQVAKACGFVIIKLAFNLWAVMSHRSMSAKNKFYRILQPIKLASLHACDSNDLAISWVFTIFRKWREEKFP